MNGYEQLIPILISVALFLIGLLFGPIIEARHLASIRKREREFRDVLVFSVRQPPPDAPAGTESRLVAGSVVLSDDAFTAVWASLRSIFGGRIAPYERLLDRARREAVLRMKSEAQSLGARMIFNVKFEATNIATNGMGSSVGALEVLSYGTALVAREGVGR